MIVSTTGLYKVQLSTMVLRKCKHLMSQMQLVTWTVASRNNGYAIVWSGHLVSCAAPSGFHNLQNGVCRRGFALDLNCQHSKKEDLYGSTSSIPERSCNSLQSTKCEVCIGHVASKQHKLA